MVKQFNEKRNNAVRKNQKKTESYGIGKYSFTVDAIVTVRFVHADSFQEAKETVEQSFAALNPYVNYIRNDDTDG